MISTNAIRAGDVKFAAVTLRDHPDGFTVCIIADRPPPPGLAFRVSTGSRRCLMTTTT